MIRFFFSSRRRHTRYWRDWSSDVCSSDLRCSRPASCRGACSDLLLPPASALKRVLTLSATSMMPPAQVWREFPRIPLPRTPVNKGKRRGQDIEQPRPSTTPFLALLHTEGLRHLRGEVS